jgi:predicted ATPase
LLKAGQPEKGLARLHAGIDAQHGSLRVFLPRSLALLAEACLEIGRVEEGLSAVHEALAETEETGVRYCEAEIKRLQGELFLASKKPNETRAEVSFRKSLDIACAHQSKSWELRAATSLARLWREQGKRAEAHELLAPVYGWFIEGFDTADLKEAKALLDELMA